MEIPGTQNRYAGPPFKHTGITCERCHGDSAAHVASGGKSAMVNPAKLDAVQRDAVCQQCHLEGEILIDRPGKKLAQFRPGELLSDYASYFVHAGAPNAGFGPVTQVEALPLSKCKQVSGDKLSCTSCHDPHRRVAEAEKVSFYRAKCLQCHSDPQYASTHHQENLDCASCHMPRNKATGIPHQQTTDHRIPRVAPPIQSPSQPGKHLESVLTAHPDDRDLGLAYAKLAENGDEFAASRAVQLLQSARLKSPHDPALFAALGFVLKKRGLDDLAIDALKTAVEIDPNNGWAAANLGVLYMKIGQNQKALQLLEASFRRNPSYAGLNLSDLDCALGRRSQVKMVLQRLRKFDPDSLEIRRRFSEIGICKEN
ncbi:MAG: tetratricopeptide repeat protein [Candidatus Acidiferrum sp.]